MEYTLEIRSDIWCDEDGGCHTVYGVNAVNAAGAVLAFPDISVDRQVVSRMVQLCVQQQVALCHLGDVVQDTICAQYLP